jgi:hypothetical protein
MRPRFWISHLLFRIKLLAWIREYSSWHHQYLKVAWIWRRIQGIKNLRIEPLKQTQVEAWRIIMLWIKRMRSRSTLPQSNFQFQRPFVVCTLVTRKKLRSSWRCSKRVRNLKTIRTSNVPSDGSISRMRFFWGGSSVTSRIFPEWYCLQKCEFQNSHLNLSAYLNYKDVFFWSFPKILDLFGAK